MDERTRLVLGDMLEVVQSKVIAIIGVGGVGSYAIESLGRLGVKKLIIVDYDTIDQTNLNRQIMTNHQNIGKSKVDEMKKRIHSYSKETDVISIKEKLTEDNIDKILPSGIDYMIDACDTISVKKELIRYSIRKHIKLISSMGTGNKLDPSKLEIIDIRKTSYDPLAKRIRKMVKDEHIKEKIMVIASSETPVKTDSRVVGSVSFVPSVAGLLATSYIVNDVIKNENRKKD